MSLYQSLLGKTLCALDDEGEVDFVGEVVACWVNSRDDLFVALASPEDIVIQDIEYCVPFTSSMPDMTKPRKPEPEESSE